jgi:hypothetical protein
VARSWAASAWNAAHDTAYIVGGIDGSNNYLREAYRYTVAGGFEELPLLPAGQGRSRATAFYIDDGSTGALYVCFGQGDSGTNLTNAYRLVDGAEAWEATGALPSGIAGGPHWAGCAIGACGYVISGGDPNTCYKNVLRLDHADNSWTQYQYLPQVRSRALLAHVLDIGPVLGYGVRSNATIVDFQRYSIPLYAYQG